MRLWLSAVLLLLSLWGFGQSFQGGVIVGMTANQIDGDDFSGYNKIGYELTAFALYKINRIYSIQSGVSLIQKGAHSPPKATFFRTTVNLAQVPVWLNIQPYPHLGGTVGINFGYIYKALYESTTILTKDELSIGDLDVSYYFGLTYKIGKRLNLRLAHVYSLLPITRPIRLECWRRSIFLFWITSYPLTQTPCWWTNTVSVTFEIKMF